MNLAQKDTLLRTGLIGASIQGSRSPKIHMDEAKALGLNLRYELFDFDLMDGGASNLAPVFQSARDQGLLGVNVTFPVKQAIMKLLDAVSPDAEALSACNTVSFAGGRTVGHNTDWIGFTEAFRRGLPDASLDHVVLLGAGGGASAVTYALLKMGAKCIAVQSRTPGKAMEFAKRFNARMDAPVFPVDCLHCDMGSATGLVNCTPLGMRGHTGMPEDINLLRPEMWVSDLVYVPLETDLLRAARAKGCRTLEGGAMAVFQAAEAFCIFTGIEPDKERMLARFEADVRAERAQTTAA